MVNLMFCSPTGRHRVSRPIRAEIDSIQLPSAECRLRRSRCHQPTIAPIGAMQLSYFRCPCRPEPMGAYVEAPRTFGLSLRGHF